MSLIKIGKMGWMYKGWRGSFYPEKRPQKELEYASRQLFRCRFIPVLKGYRTLQIIKCSVNFLKRLKDVGIPFANFFVYGLLVLNEKLGPILRQLPLSMIFDPEKFENFFTLLPKDSKEAKKLGKKNNLPKEATRFSSENYKMRNAIEIRNISFLNPWFIELLQNNQFSLVFADTAEKCPYMEDVTSDFIYKRLHGDSILNQSGYDDNTIRFWSERIWKWSDRSEPQNKLTLCEKSPLLKPRDVFVYFDNDAKAHAPTDGKRLISLHKEDYGPL